MITELASREKVIGVKQSRKAIREGRARRVYLACDADPAITDPVAASCAAAGIPVETEPPLAPFGQACRIRLIYTTDADDEPTRVGFSGPPTASK